MEDQSSKPEITQERTPRLNHFLTNEGHSIIVQNGNYALYVETQHENESSEVSSSEYNDQVHDYTENNNGYQEIAEQFSNEIKPAGKITFQRQWKEQENQEQEKLQSMHEYRKEELISETRENKRNRDKKQSQHSQDSRINKKKGKIQYSRECLMRRDRKQESKSKKQINKSRQSVQSSSLVAISPPKTSRRIRSPQYQSSLQKKKQLRSAQETRRQKEYKSIEEECRKCEKFFQILGENESDTKTSEALNKKKDLMQQIRRDLRKYRIQRRERFQQDLRTDDKIFEIRAILEGKIQKQEELMRYIETHGTDSYSDSELKLFFQETEGLILNFDEMDRRIEQNQSLGVLSIEDLCAKEAQEEQNKVGMIEDDDRELVERLNARNQAKHQEEIQKMKSLIGQLRASHEKENKARTEKQKQVEAKHNEEIQRLRNSIEQMMASHEKTKELQTEKQKQVQRKHQEEIQRLRNQIDELTASNANLAELYTGKQKQVEKLKDEVKDQEKKCSDHQREYEVRMQELSRQLLLKEEQSKAFDNKLIEKEKQLKEQIDRLMDQANVRVRKHEQAMQELKKDLQFITSKCQDEVRHEQTERVKAEESHKLREQQLKNNLIQIEKQFQRMVTEHQGRVKELNDEIDRLIEQQETLKEIYDHNIERLDDELKKQNDEKEKLRQSHEKQKAKLVQNLEEQKAKFRENLEDQIKELKEKIIKQKAQINQLHRKTQELYITYQDQLKKAQGEFQKQIQGQKISHKKEIEGKDGELLDMKKKLDDMREDLKSNRSQFLKFRQNNSPKYIKINLIDQTSENVNVIDGDLHQNSHSLENHNEQTFSLNLSSSNRTNRSRQIDTLRMNQIMTSSRRIYSSGYEQRNVESDIYNRHQASN